MLMISEANAFQDFEFIHANRWHTDFVKDIAASRIDNGPSSRLQAALISDSGLVLPHPQQALYSDADLLGSFDPLILQRSRTVGETRATQRQKTQLLQERKKRMRLRLERFCFAIAGGLLINGPVLVLGAGTADAKALVVVSVSVALFSLGIAWFSSASPENILAATAAYAAVLVAFINTPGMGHDCNQVSSSQ